MNSWPMAEKRSFDDNCERGERGLFTKWRVTRGQSLSLPWKKTVLAHVLNDAKPKIVRLDG